MRYVFDSSVLVAGLVECHPHHHRAMPWLGRMARGEIAVALAAHALAQTYSALTSLPISPKIQPGLAWQLVRDNTANAEIVSLTQTDYRNAIQRVAELGHAGGVVYDALIVCVAIKLNADGLVTFNVRHFRQIWPEGHDRIISP